MGSGSDDDEDLRRAIAMSLQDGQGSTAETPIELESKQQLESKDDVLQPNGLGILGLNRKQMEQERLSRKRKASISPHPVPKASLGVLSDSSKRSKDGNDPTFLHGTVKRTLVRGEPKTSDVITLEEILEKDDLQLAVFSSFQWDIPWLFAKLNVSETLITLVMQAKDDATKEQYRQETSYLPKLRLCFPSMEGQINCMHSKLMLLSHKKHLRIVVPTANLVSYDWGETGTMENMCFIIDLPRLPGGSQQEKLTYFGEELVYFLTAQKLESSIVKSLYKFDFSATESLAFVHTIGGAHIGPEEPWRRTGFCGLGQAVERLGLSTKRSINMDFVTSSVGSLNLDFLSSLYLACQGDGGSTIYEFKSGGKSKEASEAKATQAKTKSLIQDHFRLYFPTHDTVRRSKAGSAGTICFQSKWYNSPTFPKSILRDCQSKCTGVLMHNKLIYVSNISRPWAYVGSANCSESAWGSLSKERSLKIPKLNCRNWECGVLVPAGQHNEIDHSEAKDDMKDDAKTIKPMESAFNGVVPVPMLYPGAIYGSKKPWYFMEQ